MLMRLFIDKAGSCLEFVRYLFVSSARYNKMEGGPSDFALVEKEVEKIAQDAIDELKKFKSRVFQLELEYLTGLYFLNYNSKSFIELK
jgi:hypothetical protein